MPHQSIGARPDQPVVDFNRDLSAPMLSKNPPGPNTKRDGRGLYAQTSPNNKGRIRQDLLAQSPDRNQFEQQPGIEQELMDPPGLSRLGHFRQGRVLRGGVPIKDEESPLGDAQQRSDVHRLLPFETLCRNPFMIRSPSSPKGWSVVRYVHVAPRSKRSRPSKWNSPSTISAAANSSESSSFRHSWKSS